MSVNQRLMCSVCDRYATDVIGITGFCAEHFHADRAREAEAICRDLAESDPVIRDYYPRAGMTEGRNRCLLCVSDGGRPDVYHVPECPWLRARAWVAKP